MIVRIGQTARGHLKTTVFFIYLCTFYPPVGRIEGSVPLVRGFGKLEAKSSDGRFAVGNPGEGVKDRSFIRPSYSEYKDIRPTVSSNDFGLVTDLAL